MHTCRIILFNPLKNPAPSSAANTRFCSDTLSRSILTPCKTQGQ